MHNRSQSACRAITALEDIIRNHSATERSLAGVAQSVIDVFEDMQESGITEFGLEAFNELSSIVLSHHGQSLNHYLQHEVADCEICAALKMRFQNT
jgi:hypothetical protein